MAVVSRCDLRGQFGSVGLVSHRDFLERGAGTGPWPGFFHAPAAPSAPVFLSLWTFLLRGVSFSDQTLVGIDLSGVLLPGMHFSNSDLRTGVFSNTDLSESDF
ncbi:MAG TPA: hypothetical protein EYQ50_17345 [Verrucomicrobiales bacterium]|nr:hypothetical protein [Verrucomicrobiales bacterium]